MVKRFFCSSKKTDDSNAFEQNHREFRPFSSLTTMNQTGFYLFVFEMKYINGKSIFITGGTGSIGKAFTKYLLKEDVIKQVTVFSRDELKQWEMEEEIPSSKLQLVLGDVRDFDRIAEVMEGHDIIIHAAALKQVPMGETNPSEFVKTNVMGTQNVIKACRQHEPECMVMLSTDKAVNPTSNYGSSKLSAEKLVIRASESRVTSFAVLRLGNVMNTRGTVLPKFLKQRLTGRLTLTNPTNTRFHLTLNEAVEHIRYTIAHAYGGEIIIPKLRSFSLKDLVSAVGRDCVIDIVGLRKGEKKHEVLISENEIPRTLENNNYFIVLPDQKESKKHQISNHYKGVLIPPDTVYSSDTATRLTTGELEDQIEMEIGGSDF